MSEYNKNLWQTIVFLFLSKFAKQANTPFAQSELVNDRNVELANRFVQMVGDKTDEKKIKFALLKAMRELEKGGMLLRLSEESLQLSSDGFARMKVELETAMTKIAQNFPESTPKDKVAPTVQ
ncbi:MAG: hypothetical protein KAU22_00635 [Desulfuromonadales bacterium]|nr:hypothetical protein [Desulfuromonadales bacterium]